MSLSRLSRLTSVGSGPRQDPARALGSRNLIVANVIAFLASDGSQTPSDLCCLLRREPILNTR
jgi:hypothetical protein